MQPSNDVQLQQDPSENTGEQESEQAPLPPTQSHASAGFQQQQPYIQHLACFLSQVLQNTLMVVITSLYQIKQNPFVRERTRLCMHFIMVASVSFSGNHGKPRHHFRNWKLIRASKHRGLASHQHVRCLRLFLTRPMSRITLHQ